MSALRIYAFEAWHELRAGLRGAMVPLMFAGLLGYVFLALASAQFLRDMGGADVPRNSSLVVYHITSGQAFWLIFVWAWVFGQVVARDHSARLEELVLAAPVSLRALLFARYLGALALACILGSSSSVALVLVPVLADLGVIPAQAVAATPFVLIGHAWLLFVLPSAVGLGAIYLIAALRTRSSTGPFVASAAIILLWMGAMVVLRGADVQSGLATVIDVSGFGEAEHQTKLWTPAEKRSSLLELTMPLLWNRALWVVVPLLLLGATLTRLRRETLVLERDRRKEKRGGGETPRWEGGSPLLPVSQPSWLRATFCDARWQAARLMSGWAFILAMALWALLNVAAPFAHMTAHAEGPLVPRGELVAPFLLHFNYIFSVFGVAAFVGALLRRDQRPGFSELVDCTPAPLGVRVLGSALATTLVTLVFAFVPALSAWLVMALAIPTAFDPWSPIVVSGAVAAPALLELAAITFLIHSLVRSAGTAHALSMFAALVAIVNHEIAIVSYPPAAIGIAAAVQLSELSGFAPWLAAVAALDAAKMAFVSFMFGLAWLVYARGTALTAALRLSHAFGRLRRGAGWLLGAASALLLLTHGVLFEQLVTRGQYRSKAARERDDAERERRFAARAAPVTLSGGEVEVTVDPGARVARTIVHLHGVRSAAGRLNGELPEGTRSITARVAGAKAPVRTELDHFEVDLLGCAAAGCGVELALAIAADGWGLQHIPPWLHESGVWARASDLVPRLGLDAERRLRAPVVRRAHSLPEDRAAVPGAALVPARGVSPAGQFRWRVRVTEPGEHTALEGETSGPLDFAVAWVPRGIVEVSSWHGLAVWHGRTRREVAAEVADDVRAMGSCVRERLGVSAQIETVLQSPRGLRDVAVHGNVLWLPEQHGWDVASRGVGRTKRRAAIAQALAASSLSYAADLRAEPGSRVITSGIAGFAGLSCVRDLDGADAWLAWMARRSEHVIERLGGLDAPLVNLAEDGSADWIDAYAPLATLAWSQSLTADSAREAIQSVVRRVRAGSTVLQALDVAFGTEATTRLLGPPIASDVAVVEHNGRLAVRGQRSRWVDGGWRAAERPRRVAEHLPDGTARVVELPRSFDRGVRITVFDAEPSFERAPRDNIWPRRSSRGE